MTSMIHELAGIHRTSEYNRPIVICTCGCIASGITGAHWVTHSLTDNIVIVSPSLNWPGHFHTTNPVTTRYIDLPPNFRACE